MTAKHRSKNSCPIVVDRSAIKSLDRGAIHDTSFSNDAKDRRNNNWQILSCPSPLSSPPLFASRRGRGDKTTVIVPTVLTKNSFDDMRRFDPGQTLVQALEREGQLFVVDA